MFSAKSTPKASFVTNYCLRPHSQTYWPIYEADLILIAGFADFVSYWVVCIAYYADFWFFCIFYLDFCWLCGILWRERTAPGDSEELSHGVNLHLRAENFTEIAFFYQHLTGHEAAYF